MTRIILMSIKPIFARQIYSRFKAYELRRKLFMIAEGDHILLYETAPVKSITGKFIAGHVRELSSEEVVSLIKRGLLRGCNDLDVPYVIGKRKVLVIEVKSPKTFRRPLSLDLLRKRIKGFRPPRSYIVIRDSEFIEVINEWLDKYDQ